MYFNLLYTFTSPRVAQASPGSFRGYLQVPQAPPCDWRRCLAEFGDREDAYRRGERCDAKFAVDFKLSAKEVVTTLVILKTNVHSKVLKILIESVISLLDVDELLSEFHGRVQKCADLLRIAEKRFEHCKFPITE